MKLTYECDFYCEEVTLDVRHYTKNGNLAIVMYCIDGEPFANLTVNLDEKLPENYAYLDVNNIANAFDFCVNNHLAEFQNEFKKSGFCFYPLMKFNMEEVKKYCEVKRNAY